LHDPFASLLYITMDEEECKKTEAAFVRLIASLNAVRLMAFGGRGRRDCWAAAVGVSDTVERSERWSSEDLAGAVAC